MKKLLIIEDDPNIIEIMQEILSSMFNEIISCTNVDDANTELKKNKYDLIILDISLGLRNGAEVIKFIIEDSDNINKSTPFVISSGIINQSFIKKNKERFAGIIIKPFEHEDLVNMVDMILNNKMKLVVDDNELPKIECVLPFTIPQLESKVNKVMESVKKNNRLKDLFKNLKYNNASDNFITEHIGMLINISTAISMALEWNTEKTLEKFVYASYLHDMALSDRPDLAKIYSTEDLDAAKAVLSKEDYKLVLHHPTLAGEKIESIVEIPSDIAAIVRQHHENPKEIGFPNKIGQSKISPLSAIFIVSHDLCHYIINNEKWSMDKYLVRYKTQFKGPHFLKIYGALDKLKP